MAITASLPPTKSRFGVSLPLLLALAMLVEWQSPNFQTMQPLEIWLIVALALALSFGIKRPSAC